MNNLFGIPEPKPYSEQRKEALAPQATMPREQIKAQMEATAEVAIDFDNLPKQKHIWVDRGLKLSCENAGHKMHQVWKPQRGKPIAKA